MGTTLRQLINMNTLRLVILAGIVAVAAAADSCYVWAAVTSDGSTTGVEFADKVSTACGVASDCLAVSYSVDSSLLLLACATPKIVLLTTFAPPTKRPVQAMATLVARHAIPTTATTRRPAVLAYTAPLLPWQWFPWRS